MDFQRERIEFPIAQIIVQRCEHTLFECGVFGEELVVLKRLALRPSKRWRWMPRNTP